MAENTLTYVLNLRENISSKLKAIGINNNEQLNTWSKIEKSVRSADMTMKNCGVSIGSISKRIEALKAQKEWIPASNKEAIRASNHEIQRLEKEITKLNNLDGGKLKKWMRDITSSIPAFVNPMTTAIYGIGKSIKIGMGEEMQKTNLKTLFKNDAQATDEYYNKITQYAIRTPYEKADLIDGQKTMMSFGISAEKSFGALKQIGDISMGDSQKMESLTLAFSQATSAGKLQGQDLLQMINAGFNPLQVISERTGESMASLKQKMSEGKISTEMLSQAFQWATDKQGLFYQGAEKASETLSGKWSNFMDSLQEIASKFYDNILSPILKPTLDFINNVVNKLSWLFREIRKGNPLIIAITATVAGLAGVILVCTSIVRIQTIAISIWGSVLKVFSLVVKGLTIVWKFLNMTLWGCPVWLIIAGIIALIGVIVFLAVKIKGWGTLWHGVVNGMKYVLMSFVDVAKLKFSIMINSFLIGINAIKFAWYKFKEAVGLGDSSANRAAINKINADTQARKQAILSAGRKVGDDAKKAKDSFSSINLQLDNSKKLSNVTKGLKDKLGLGANRMLQTSIDNGGNNVGNGAGGNVGAGGQEAITQGGQRSTNIKIDFKNLIGTMSFNGGFGENRADVENQVAEALFRVLNIAQSSVS
jgi:tape measure domain